ncbi:hypothetical protein D1793_18860 [Halomonas sp. JS92-SW72]|nr:hypothetical protein D1793_18860 [Halomonas sp. JS92-SW72]
MTKSHPSHRMLVKDPLDVVAGVLLLCFSLLLLLYLIPNHIGEPPILQNPMMSPRWLPTIVGWLLVVFSALMIMQGVLVADDGEESGRRFERGPWYTRLELNSPAWYPPESVQREARARGEEAPSVVPPGPDNPLGDHAIILGFDGYLIHGTNQPDGIGMRASRGCIRMFPGDIESIFDRVPAGTQVQIVNQPIKIGWYEGQPLIQAFSPLEGEGHSMSTLVETVTRLNQRKAEGWSFDYEQLRGLLNDPSDRIVALNPRPEPDKTHDTDYKGIYAEIALRRL